MFDIAEETLISITNQDEFKIGYLDQPTVSDLLEGDKAVVLLLQKDEFELNHELVDDHIYIATPTIRGNGKTILKLVGQQYSLRGHQEKNRINLLGAVLDGIVLTSSKPIEVTVSDRCLSTWDNVHFGKNVTTINIDHEIEAEQPVSVYNQDELNSAIENHASEIHLHGDIFTLNNDAGSHTIIGKNEQTIVIIEGVEGTSIKLDSDAETDEVNTFETMFLTFDNVIISSVDNVELPFMSREGFESWSNITYDTSKVDIVIMEDEFNEFDASVQQGNKDDLAFLRKYQVSIIGIDGDPTSNAPESSALSYQDACLTYEKTDLKVGGVIGAMLKEGYYRFGIFGGKNRIISIDPDTDLVAIIDHEKFLEGTGFFNGSEVHRMGVEGESIKKSMLESYEAAIGLLGEEYDDEDFVTKCRLEHGDDRDLTRMDSVDFLSDL